MVSQRLFQGHRTMYFTLRSQNFLGDAECAMIVIATFVAVLSALQQAEQC